MAAVVAGLVAVVVSLFVYSCVIGQAVEKLGDRVARLENLQRQESRRRLDHAVAYAQDHPEAYV